jgi:cell division ATPase FtsA
MLTVCTGVFRLKQRLVAGVGHGQYDQAGVVPVDLVQTRNNRPPQPDRQAVQPETVRYGMPGIEVVVAGIALVGGGRGIEGAVVLAEDHLHVESGLIHVGRQREVERNLTPGRAGHLKLGRRTGIGLVDYLRYPRKDVAEAEIVVHGDALRESTTRRHEQREYSGRNE